MFEKGMDERMIHYRGQAMILGCAVSIALLLFKDALADFEIIQFTGIITIADLLLIVIGVFTMIIYLIHQQALKDSYLLNAWRNFAVLAIFSLLWLVPSLLAGRQLMIANCVTMTFLKVIQTVLFSGFAIYLYVVAVRTRRELGNHHQ